MTRNTGIVAYLNENEVAFTGNTSFQTIVTNTIAHIATVNEAAVATFATVANNTGYSIDKVNAKEAARQFASEWYPTSPRISSNL